jgi:hypothetical protein
MLTINWFLVGLSPLPLVQNLVFTDICKQKKFNILINFSHIKDDLYIFYYLSCKIKHLNWLNIINFFWNWSHLYIGVRLGDNSNSSLLQSFNYFFNYSITDLYLLKKNSLRQLPVFPSFQDLMKYQTSGVITC